MVLRQNRFQCFDVIYKLFLIRFIKFLKKTFCDAISHLYTNIQLLAGQSVISLCNFVADIIPKFIKTHVCDDCIDMKQINVKSNWQAGLPTNWPTDRPTNWRSDGHDGPWKCFGARNRSPKGIMWSAIPDALLCMIVNWIERKQGSPWRGQSPVEHRGL